MNDDRNGSEDLPPYEDPPELYGAHFLTCRSVWFDPRLPGANFGVAGIYTHIEPPEGQAFPVRFNRIFAYVQL